MDFSFQIKFLFLLSFELAEKAFLPESNSLSFPDHLPGQVRDWNEELQVTHDMARQSLSERLVRDRSIYKIHGDFINAAIKARLFFLYQLL